MRDEEYRGVVARVVARYARSGRVAQGFVRGKLRHDPVFRSLVDRGLAESPRVVDLGCGRGILLALMLEARRSPDPPGLHGVELAAAPARIAREALDGAAAIVEADLGAIEVPECDAVAILDVLHYLAPDVQADLLARVRAALPVDGRLFIREADAGAGAGFFAVTAGERLCAIARGDGIRRFSYVEAGSLTARLEALGFKVGVTPMGGGTPFANLLWEARVSP